MFSSNLRQIMKEKKKTVRDLASETGLSSATIQRARGDGIAECRLSTLGRIGSALGVKTKGLYEEAEESKAE